MSLHRRLLPIPFGFSRRDQNRKCFCWFSQQTAWAPKENSNLKVDHPKILTSYFHSNMRTGRRHCTQIKKVEEIGENNCHRLPFYPEFAAILWMRPIWAFGRNPEFPSWGISYQTHKSQQVSSYISYELPFCPGVWCHHAFWLQSVELANRKTGWTCSDAAVGKRAKGRKSWASTSRNLSKFSPSYLPKPRQTNMTVSSY